MKHFYIALKAKNTTKIININHFTEDNVELFIVVSLKTILCAFVNKKSIKMFEISLLGNA